jgi:hypothetical protein
MCEGEEGIIGYLDFLIGYVLVGEFTFTTRLDNRRYSVFLFVICIGIISYDRIGRIKWIGLPQLAMMN